MEILNDAMMPIAKWLRGNLYQVSLMMVATLLVVYGSNLNALVRNAVSGFHFAVRVAVFVALCAFGYGLITVYTVPWVSKGLGMLPNLWLPLVILGIFVALGVVAEKKKV